jgi:zinc protease
MKWMGVLLLMTAAHSQTIPKSSETEAPKAPPAGRRGGSIPSAPAAGRGASPAAGTSVKDLRYPALRPIQNPEITNFTLSNGMRISLMEDHELPLVSGMAIVKTGSLLDPPQQIGMAQLTGIMLRTGGSNIKTPEQINTLLEDNASNIESVISESRATVSFNALKENSPATLQLFKELLAQPGFRQEKMDGARAQMRENVSRRNDVQRTLTHREFAGLIYGKDNAYGWQPEYGTLDHVKRADVRAFHQRYFFPANVVLGVWGDFNAPEMKALLERVFGDWKAQPAAVPDFPKVKNAPAPGIFLAEKKDAQQTYFSIGHLAGLRSDKDFAALEVMAGVLGGGPGSRIAEKLRNRLAVGNEVTATWNAGYLQPGLFEIAGSTKSVSTTETIAAIKEEIDRLRTAEVTEEECRIARDAALNAMIFRNDSRGKLFERQLVLEHYGYPKDYLAQHQKALQAVTRADVTRVAKQYLNPANLTIVVSANPILFGSALDKLGPVTKLDLTIPEAPPAVVETTAASLAQAKQILALAQAAAGGTKPLEAVNDYTLLAEYQIDPSVTNLGGSKVMQTDRWVKPTVLRQDSTLPAGRVSAYTDGKVGWISTPQGWGALTGVQRSQVFGDLFRVYFRLLLSDRIEGRTVNAIEENTVQVTDTTGLTSTVEFDPRTHLPKRVSYDTAQASGAPIYSEDVYEDYRNVGGLMLPFKITINQGGNRFADTTVKEYKINTGLNPQELGRRPL